MKILSYAVIATFIFVTSYLQAQTIVDFEDINLNGALFDNGADSAGGFTSQGANLNNSYVDFGGGFFGWYGWTISRVMDSTTPGFGNENASFPGSGDQSDQYGVIFGFPGDAIHLDIPAGHVFDSMRVSTTTYTALSVLNGDSFAKKFGGSTGNDRDFFFWRLTGRDESQQVTGSLDVYLADYRFSDNSMDYVIDEWTTVDLTPLGNAVRIEFEAFSSDIGPFGINTPAYMAIDNVVYSVPEPASWALVSLVVGTGLIVGRRRRQS